MQLARSQAQRVDKKQKVPLYSDGKSNAFFFHLNNIDLGHDLYMVGPLCVSCKHVPLCIIAISLEPMCGTDSVAGIGASA